MMIETVSKLQDTIVAAPLAETLKPEKTASKPKEKTDSIELSKEALETLEKTKEQTAKDRVENLKKKQLEAMEKEKQVKAENEDRMKSMKAQAEMQMKAANTLGKCMTISARIMGGDRVPLKDERFLAENQPEMYARALMLRRQKKDPKDYKSILEDEKDPQSSEAISGASPEISTESPAIEEGGAEVATPESRE